MTNAKQIILTATLLLLSIGVSFSQSDSTEIDICTGAVGDVKYSIFEEQKFREFNGDCWVLMDGRPIGAETTLAEMGIPTIPDARGVFIRSLDTQRDSVKRRDLNRNFGTKAGHYQVDATRLPNNKFGTSIPRKIRVLSKSGGCSGGCPRVKIDEGSEALAITGGDAETRPKNIILYTYIRID